MSTYAYATFLVCCLGGVAEGVIKGFSTLFSLLTGFAPSDCSTISTFSGGWSNTSADYSIGTLESGSSTWIALDFELSISSCPLYKQEHSDKKFIM